MFSINTVGMRLPHATRSAIARANEVRGPKRKWGGGTKID